MKKKFILGGLILWTSLFGIFSLNAASNRIQIVSENYAAKQLSTDGTNIINQINVANTDLVNGNVAIEIIINNSKNTEIFYAIDNGKSIGSNKGTVIDSIKNNAKAMEDLDNIKQGIVTTTNGNTSLIALDSANIEMQLDSVKSATVGNSDGGIFDSIDKAVENFSTDATEKIIVVAVTSLGSSIDANNLKTKIDNYKAQGIKFIVYGINVTDKTNFQNIFNSTTKYDYTTSQINQIAFASDIATYLPKPKHEMNTSITFDNYILNNFEIKEVKTDFGTASYDSTTNQVNWNAGTIGANQVAKLTYYLSLKNIVDESVIEKLTLRTNRQIVVTGTSSDGIKINGTYPANDKIDDQVCSPTIMILREAVDNPKTGMTDYIVFGACLLSVGAITILILNRKNQFSRI